MANAQRERRQPLRVVSQARYHLHVSITDCTGTPPLVTGDFHRTSHWAQSDDARSVALWLFKLDFPRSSACLERRCAAPHASPPPPCACPSLPHRLSARTGLRLSTCPCHCFRFDAIPRVRRRHVGARAPPSSPRRSALFIAGVPASAHRSQSNPRALPLARPPLPPRPQPSSPCLRAGSLVDHLAARAWSTTPAPRL